MSKVQTVYIVTEQQSEGGWGFADFQVEVYDSEPCAQARVAKLNAACSPYCGYYYTYEPATFKPTATKNLKCAFYRKRNS